MNICTVHQCKFTDLNSSQSEFKWPVDVNGNGGFQRNFDLLHFFLLGQMSERHKHETRDRVWFMETVETTSDEGAERHVLSVTLQREDRLHLTEAARGRR